MLWYVIIALKFFRCLINNTMLWIRNSHKKIYEEIGRNIYKTFKNRLITSRQCQSRWRRHVTNWWTTSKSPHLKCDSRPYALRKCKGFWSVKCVEMLVLHIDILFLLRIIMWDYNHNHRFIKFILSYPNLLTLSNIASTLPLEYDDSVQLHLRRVGTCDCALYDSISTTEENMSFLLLIFFK